MSNVTILGLGAMGQRMAVNLLKAGHDLHVWNRTPERCKTLVKLGAKQSSSPQLAVQNADFIISMLSNDEASRDVWLNKKNGAILALQESAIAIECSTLSYTWCKSLSQVIMDNHAEFLDAPVVGSRPQAEAAQLIYLVGGKKEVLKKANKVLGASAANVHHVGSIGKGMLMKLAINGLFAIQVAALGEILGLLDQAGIPSESAVAVLNELPTTSPALKGIGSAIAASNYSPLFPINLVNKDLAYLEQLAATQHSEIPSVTTTKQIFQLARESGYGDDNIAGVVQLYL